MFRQMHLQMVSGLKLFIGDIWLIFIIICRYESSILGNYSATGQDMAIQINKLMHLDNVFEYKCSTMTFNVWLKQIDINMTKLYG